MEDQADYRIDYNYGPGARVDFSVVWPEFELWTQVRLAKDAQFTDQYSGHSYNHIPRLVRFAVLGYQNSHIIVVAVNPKTGEPPRPDPSGKFTGLLSREFQPYRRIATSASPITSLQAIVDNAENVTLNYTDHTGRSFTLKLNPDRKVVP